MRREVASMVQNCYNSLTINQVNMKLLLLFLLLPVCLTAQEVGPVISKDYLALINKDSTKNGFRPDTMNSMDASSMKSGHFFNGELIRNIKIKRGLVEIQPALRKQLLIGGNFNSTVEIKHINQQPALQTAFVQGRDDNGKLVWRGPETGELFSYGPAINTLEFDGSNYPYDVSGKLTPLGMGNGQAARAYPNNIFRTTALTGQSFTIESKYLVGGRQLLSGSVNLGQTTENTVITANKNTGHTLLTSLEAAVGTFTIAGAYNYIQERFSNSNRNGFLNRVYENALLSPVSFDNTQGALTGAQQRSYSNAADNPFFLLDRNGNSFLQTHQTGTLTLGRSGKHFWFKLIQSAEALHQNSNEGYKPGSAYFQNGIAVNRIKSDANYFLDGNASYNFRYFDSYHLSSVVTFNYAYANNHSAIDYHSSGAYHYQRSSNDFSLAYNTSYSGYWLDAGLNFANKFYISNTAGPGSFFLPSASGFIRVNDLFDWSALSVKLAGSYTHSNNELPIDQSFSSTGLLQYSTQQALQYFPVTEVRGFNNLAPIRHSDWSGMLELNYSYRLNFRAEVFRRTTVNDIFPVLENGQPVLKNLASHRNYGVELEAIANSTINKVHMSNSISFFTNRAKVTEVKDGYDYTPLAGFSDVHKALVKGEAPGVIVGSSYLKDAHNNMIIGTDGFPLVNATPAVIGNPIPDFVIKTSHNLDWKNFTLALDLEWKKGGSVWNGTGAVLDYYGRSAGSARLRNTTGYVFAGVMTDGHPNTIPVNFYDAAQPVENNRWTRYGYSGVAEAYIQKGDHVRINNISLRYKLPRRKYVQNIAFTVYAGNILVWTAYKGADPNQVLYDQPGANGLDFFNLPSTKTFGCNVSVQF